jgi:hypothetical protein
MEFPRVELAIKTCAEHLDKSGARNTEIEAVLVGYLLTITYADYERAIREMVAQRGNRYSDGPLASFMTTAARRLIRSIEVGEIGGILGHFDASCKTAFNSAIADTPAQTAFDNLLANRHDVAHRLGANITLAEFEKTFRASQPVLQAVQDALQLT